MKILTILLAALLATSSLITAEASAFFPFPDKVSPDSTQSSGKVTNIDLRKSLVTIALSDGTTSTFMVEDKTTFFKKGKKIGISDLKKGDVVKIDYFVKKGKNRARAINVDELASSNPRSLTTKKKQ